MSVQIGDVFWHTVTYRSGESETRPIVIFDICDDEVLAGFATITGAGIKDFDGTFDKWKVALHQWASAGLEKPSYVKANCYAYIPISAFETKKYIGQLHRTDFVSVKRKIEEFVESDETPW